METVTIKDVAKLANVSVATVSRVINNPYIVASEKRIAVQKAIQALQYVPNASARELVVGSSRIIGVLISDLNNIFISTVVSRFVNRLDSLGYSVSIGISSSKPAKEKKIIMQMLQKRVEAIVLFGVRKIDQEMYDWMSDRLGSIPLVKVGPSLDDFSYKIYTEEEKGAYLAVEHLIQLGHRRIAFINGQLSYDSYYCKQRGYQKAMSSYDLVVDPEYVINVPPRDPMQVYESAARLLRLPNRPTAVLMHGDQNAWYIYRAAAELGIQIPKDVAVVGFGNTPFSPFMLPSLTTIDQQPEQFGEKIADITSSIINGETSEREWSFDVQLIQRESTIGKQL